MNNDEKRNAQIRRLKTTLLRRGVSPDKFINLLMAFQKMLCGARTHDELEVMSKMLMAMNVSVQLHHAKFRAEGGHDERASFELN